MSGSWPAIHPGISLNAYCQSLQNHSKYKADFLVRSDVVLQLVDRVQKVCVGTPEIQVDERLSQVDARLDQVIQIVKHVCCVTKSLTATSLPHEQTPPRMVPDRGELRKLIQSTIAYEIAKARGSPTTFMTQNEDFKIKVNIHDVAVKQLLQKKSYEAPGALVSATNKVIREARIQVEVSDVQQLSSGDLFVYTKTPEDRQKLIDEARKWTPGMATVAPDTYQVVMHNVRVASIDLSIKETAETIKDMLFENRHWLRGDSRITHVRWLGEKPENGVTSIVVNFSHPEDANAALDKGITWLGDLKKCALFEGAHTVTQPYQYQQYPPGGLQQNREAKTIAPDDGSTGVMYNQSQLMQPREIQDDIASYVDAFLDSIASEYVPVQAHTVANTAAATEWLQPTKGHSKQSASVGLTPTKEELLELEDKLRKVEIRVLKHKLRKAKGVLKDGDERRGQTPRGQSLGMPKPKPKTKGEPKLDPKLEPRLETKLEPKPEIGSKSQRNRKRNRKRRLKHKLKLKLKRKRMSERINKSMSKPKPEPKACSHAVVDTTDAQHNISKLDSVGTHSQRDLDARTTSWPVSAGSVLGLVTGGISPSKGGIIKPTPTCINPQRGKKRKAPRVNVNFLPLGTPKRPNSIHTAATLVHAGHTSGCLGPTPNSIQEAATFVHTGHTTDLPHPSPKPAQPHSSVSGAVPILKIEKVENTGPRSYPSVSGAAPMPKRVMVRKSGPQSDSLESYLEAMSKRVKVESPEPVVMNYCEV